VILPRSRDPQRRDGSPLAVWVEGDVYDQPGVWQRLAIRDLPTLVQRQVWIKRGQPQPWEVDDREAHLDLVVLNAYTAPGVTDLWIDELEMQGFTEVVLPAPSVASNGDASWPSDDSPLGGYAIGATAIAQQQSPHLEGATLVAGTGPLAVRMIEHRGESLAWLKSLGFNAVRLPRPASEQELEEARRLDVWLIAPPPRFDQGGSAAQITSAYDRVAAWDLGSNLGERELEMARRVAHGVRGDDRLERPLLAAPSGQFWGYRRFADVLLLGDEPLGTRRDIVGFRSQIHQQASQTSRPGPVWAHVQTAPSGELLAQLEAIAGERVAATVEFAQVRLLALAALEAGATGFCFRSPAPLDAGDPASQHRAAVVHAVNEELSLVAPWISGSSPQETLDVGSDDIRATAWSAERSKLILLARHYADDQFTAAPSPLAPVSILISGAPPSWKAYKIGGDRLVPLASSQVGGGMRIQLTDMSRAEWIVVTDDPLTMNFVAGRLRQSVAVRAKLRHEILSRELALAEQVLAAAPADTAREEGLRGLDETRQAMRQCERLLDASDYSSSLEMGERAANSLAHVRRQTWWGAANAFVSRVGSPCCCSFGALPWHWNVTGRVRSSAWGPNLLAAGDFEEVRQMQSSGWTQERDPNRSAAPLVELSPDRPQQGRFSLHLGFVSHDASAESGADVEAPPVRIATAPVTLNAGDLARISGWVRGADDAAQRPLLRVRDSLGGKPLADELVVTSQWRPFVLYRAAARPTRLTIALELLSPGEVWIDNLSVEVLQAGAPGQIAQQP
jgi:hypothetical protein